MLYQHNGATYSTGRCIGLGWLVGLSVSRSSQQKQILPGATSSLSLKTNPAQAARTIILIQTSKRLKKRL